MKTFRWVLPDPPRMASEKEPLYEAGRERRVGFIFFFLGGFLVFLWLLSASLLLPELERVIASYRWENQIVEIRESSVSFEGGRARADVKFEIQVGDKHVPESYRFFRKMKEDEFGAWSGNYAIGGKLDVLVSPSGDVMLERWSGFGVFLSLAFLLFYAFMAFKAGRLRFAKSTELLAEDTKKAAPVSGSGSFEID